MSSTVYVDGVTTIVADSMNDFDRVVYTILGDPATAIAAKLTLGAANREAIAYRYTGFDPSDLIGTTTNGASTAAASITATDYLTFANSSGTLTITCVKAGSYLVTVAMQNELATALATDGNTVVGLFVLGGTGTLLWPATTTLLAAEAFSGGDYTISGIGGGCSFMVTLTAAQTVTILPKIAVVSSAGATTDFTTQCTVTASYQGT